MRVQQTVITEMNERSPYMYMYLWQAYLCSENIIIVDEPLFLGDALNVENCFKQYNIYSRTS